MAEPYFHGNRSWNAILPQGLLQFRSLMIFWRMPHRRSGRTCLFDHVAIAATVYLGVHNPEDADCNASCDKALHLEIPSGSFIFASCSSRSPCPESGLR
jgi:hypothetical protein